MLMKCEMPLLLSALFTHTHSPLPNFLIYFHNNIKPMTFTWSSSHLLSLTHFGATLTTVFVCVLFSFGGLLLISTTPVQAVKAATVCTLSSPFHVFSIYRWRLFVCCGVVVVVISESIAPDTPNHYQQQHIITRKAEESRGGERKRDKC